MLESEGFNKLERNIRKNGRENEDESDMSDGIMFAGDFDSFVEYHVVDLKSYSSPLDSEIVKNILEDIVGDIKTGYN